MCVYIVKHIRLFEVIQLLHFSQPCRRTKSFVIHQAEEKVIVAHGISTFGDLKYPADFKHLDYVNPDAPKGGTYRWGEAGSYDSFNPYVTKGRPAIGISTLTVETLLGRNYDEAFSLYGLLAESIDTDEARTYVEFTLRPEARFSDGSPVTVDDVNPKEA